MKNIAIKIENLSKQYRLGEIGTGTLSQDLKRSWARMRGQEDPYAKVGETNDRTVKSSSQFVWALKDVNFEVNKGDVLGIIGRNGAGKSTLLKILSRTTLPTTGTIKVDGRLASLLEVGTGFHPDLTGRDNIFLNGAILGMTKREIKSKFDEIVDFAGVERYIETPVKRYSSGMYVRLAFAVAAFLDPDILVVDEVLAVGDSEFQKKAIGKMKSVSTDEGRTVLFVSHNMDSIRELTNKSVLMKHGTVIKYGDTADVIMEYMQHYSKFEQKLEYQKDELTTVRLDHLLREVYISKVRLTNTDSIIYEQGTSINFELDIEEKLGKSYSNLVIGIRIMTLDEKPVSTSFSPPTVAINANEQKTVRCRFDRLNLAPGKYYFTFWIGYGDHTNYGKDFDSIDKSCFIEIIPKSGSGISPVWYHQNWGNVNFDNFELV